MYIKIQVLPHFIFKIYYGNMSDKGGSKATRKVSNSSNILLQLENGLDAKLEVRKCASVYQALRCCTKEGYSSSNEEPLVIEQKVDGRFTEGCTLHDAHNIADLVELSLDDFEAVLRGKDSIDSSEILREHIIKAKRRRISDRERYYEILLDQKQKMEAKNIIIRYDAAVGAEA